MGDFSDIEKEARLKQWQRDQEVKKRVELSRKELLKESLKGVVLGDFSSMEARKRNEKREAFERKQKARKAELEKTYRNKEKGRVKER